MQMTNFKNKYEILALHLQNSIQSGKFKEARDHLMQIMAENLIVNIINTERKTKVPKKINSLEKTEPKVSKKNGFEDSDFDDPENQECFEELKKKKKKMEIQKTKCFDLKGKTENFDKIKIDKSDSDSVPRKKKKSSQKKENSSSDLKEKPRIKKSELKQKNKNDECKYQRKSMISSSENEEKYEKKEKPTLKKKKTVKKQKTKISSDEEDEKKN